MKNKRFVFATLLSVLSLCLYAQNPSNTTNIRHFLGITIPQDNTGKITSIDTLKLFLKNKDFISLDFKGTLDGPCVINGKERNVDFLGGTILIPKKFMKQGENIIVIPFTAHADAYSRAQNYVSSKNTPESAETLIPWVTGTGQAIVHQTVHARQGWRAVTSDPRLPMSRAEVAFFAGAFNEKTFNKDEHVLHGLFSNSALSKARQIDTVLGLVNDAIDKMQVYTNIGIVTPFYNILIFPKDQFTEIDGGNAISFLEEDVLLDDNAPMQEKARRFELIAHKVAHLWIGQMARIQEPWGKELIANLLASNIVNSLGSNINYPMYKLLHHYDPVTDIDRTEASHPIVDMKALSDGKCHVASDYETNKALIMMNAMEGVTGETAFKEGIKDFLQEYKGKTATWNELLSIIGSHAPGIDLKEFFDTWTTQSGFPVIHTTYSNGKLIITQSDPSGKNRVWKQKFVVTLCYDMEKWQHKEVIMRQGTVSINLDKEGLRKPANIIANSTGTGYGIFTVDREYAQTLPLKIMITRNEIIRYNLVKRLHEYYKMGMLRDNYFGEMLHGIERETNPVVATELVNNMFDVACHKDPKSRRTLELCIHDMLLGSHYADTKLAILRLLSTRTVTPELTRSFYNIWKNRSQASLNERDYMNMAYHLAIVRPEEWKEIISTQRGRMTNGTLIKEFDYVSQACNPDFAAQQKMLRDMITADGDQDPAWMEKALWLLSYDVREPHNIAMISQALDALPALQKKYGEEFASQWVDALLSGHVSSETGKAVRNYLAQHQTLPPDLRNAILAGGASFLDK